MISHKDKRANDFLECLKGDLFRIIPMFEEKSETLTRYLISLISDLNELENVVDETKNNARYITLLCTLEAILDESIIMDDSTFPFIRSEIFKCLSLVEKMQFKGDTNELL